MNWKYTDSTNTVVFKDDASGMMISMHVSAPEFQAWLAAGNTPEPSIALTNKELLARELFDLNSEYQKDLSIMKEAWSTIGIVDGPTEEAKKAALRLQWEARKTEYLAAVVSARAKYPT